MSTVYKKLKIDIGCFYYTSMKVSTKGEESKQTIDNFNEKKRNIDGKSKLQDCLHCFEVKILTKSMSNTNRVTKIAWLLNVIQSSIPLQQQTHS